MVKTIINKIQNDKFVRNSFIFTVGTLFVSFLSYLFHPVLGRIMSFEDFGEVQTLVSIFGQISILFGAFSVIVINITTNIDDKNEREDVIVELRKVLLLLTCIISICLIIFSFELKKFFFFDSIYPFIILSIILPFSALTVFRSAMLQGLKDFSRVNIVNFFSTGGRLIFAAAFVYVGWRSFGAMIGLLAAQLIALVYVYGITKDHLHSSFDFSLRKIREPRIKNELQFGILVLFVTSCVSLLNLTDVVYVKHYFDSSTAGIYSGISTIGKIIFFISGPIASVMIPSITLKNIDNNNYKTLFKAVILTLLVGGTVLLTFWLFSDTVISFLLGSRYLAIPGILAKVSVLFFIISFINLFFNFYLALRRYYLIIISIFGLICPLILNYYWHLSLGQIINNFIISSLGVFMFLIATLAVERYYEKSKKTKII